MRIDSVTKNFGSLVALHEVSAVFDAGRIYILAGPNGAGKTTLLRIIAGIIGPTSGRISFNGGSHDRDYRPAMGVMMQESYLYRDLTPRENLELYASLHGIAKSRPGEVVRLLELDRFLDQRVDDLSHGQKQRVSLARALLSDPEILLLDEPFLGLDAASVAHVQDFLAGYKGRGGLALIATHEMGLVKGIADNLLFIEAGRVAYCGVFKEPS